MRFKVVKTMLCALIIMILASGCNSNVGSRPASGGDKLTIVTSFYPMYVHTINVTKGIQGVRVINMTKPQTGCLHDYALNTDNLKTLSDAQIFIVNGADMESFMDKVIKQLPNLKVIEASKGIELLKDQQSGEENPHVWVSITNTIQQVKNIGERLAEVDPANANGYRSNTKAYVEKLERQKEKMHKALDNIKSKDIVTFHEAFPYFAQEFDLNIVAVIEREPGSEPSAQELKNTIETIKKNKVKAVFTEPQYSSKAAETISRETGVKIYVLDPVVTGEATGDTEAYVSIMDNNLKVLEEALS